MKTRFSLRSLFIVAAVIAVVVVLIRRPNLSVEYHSNVSAWNAQQADGVTEWRQERSSPIVYSDTDGDGRINSRIEQKRDYLIVSLDTDRDGVFDEEWVQRLARDEANAADGKSIHRPVPTTSPNEP